MSTQKETSNQLEIQGLGKTYGNGVKALTNINLSLNNGLFGLLGPNGSGKSTLMRTVATLQEPGTGTVWFNGSDIHRNPDAIRPVLGYLPQEFGVFPRASARRLLEYIAALKGLPVKNNPQIDELLDVTNLLEHQHRAVATYSGGMLRRFGIAQALLGSPRVLIIDEPTAGLDPEECRHFHRLLCQVAERMVVILSTHIVEDVRHLCSRLAILARGQIRFQGSPEQLAGMLDGKVWTAPESVFQELQNDRIIHLATRIRQGRPWVRVFAATCPGSQFQACSPEIEDGYFYALREENTSVKTCEVSHV